MAYATIKPTKPGLEEPMEQIHKIRITLSSKSVKNLEKGSTARELELMTKVDELSAQIENDKVEQRARDEAVEKKLEALQQLIANQHRREDGTSSHG